MGNMSTKLLLTIIVTILVSLSGYVKNVLLPPRMSQATQTETKQIKDEIVGELVSVIDGDTVIIHTLTEKNVHVRFMGVNAPETSSTPYRKSECGGDEAKARMKELVKKGDHITLVLDSKKESKDKYGRTLGYLFKTSSNISINEEIISLGYGREYTYKKEKYDFQSIFKTTQENAKNDTAGLWATCWNK
jgi:micrococcal nuclease